MTDRLAGDAKYAFRVFRRQAGVVAIAIAGRAPSIAMTTVVFTNAFNFRPLVTRMSSCSESPDTAGHRASRLEGMRPIAVGLLVGLGLAFFGTQVLGEARVESQLVAGPEGPHLALSSFGGQASPRPKPQAPSHI
jgi:hypothetical protein